MAALRPPEVGRAGRQERVAGTPTTGGPCSPQRSDPCSPTSYPCHQHRDKPSCPWQPLQQKQREQRDLFPSHPQKVLLGRVPALHQGGVPPAALPRLMQHWGMLSEPNP